MPSTETSDHELTPAKPSTPAVTQQRPSPAKHTSNGTGRRRSAQKTGAPKSAPARGVTKTKKVEPTLLGDFLLGRPSPARMRRKSLEVVKAEMKAGSVNRIQSPGGVKDRVKQWQRVSAAAVIVDPACEADDVATGVAEEKTDGVQQRIKRKQTNSNKQKSDGKSQPADSGGSKAADAMASPRAEQETIAPKKRVVSDDHWMQKNRRTPPKKKSPIVIKTGTGTARLSRDFVQKNSVVPSVTKKIQDWAKQTAEFTTEDSNQYTSKQMNPKEHTGDEGYADESTSDEDVADGGPSIPSKSKSKSKSTVDDGIRVKPLKTNPMGNDGIRIKPLKADTTEDDSRVKSIRKNRADASVISEPVTDDQSNDGRSDIKTKGESRSRFGEGEKRSRSQKELSSRPLSTKDSTRKGSSRSRSARDTDEPYTPTRKKSRSTRKSESPSDTLADIPVGFSAFSVLDIPVGADANSMRPQKPLRNHSYKAVPNVFRKVYTEGMKIVHETAETPRLGINQPPSIESWLNGTSDPFLDSPAVPAPDLEGQKAVKVEVRSLIDRPEQKDITKEPGNERQSERSRRRRARSSTLPDSVSRTSEEENEPPSGARNSNYKEKLSTARTPPPSTPTGLKRKPAVRNASSPIRSARKMPLKERVAEAFRGESTVESPSTPDQHDTYEEHRSERSTRREPPPPRSRGIDDVVNDDTSRQSSLKRSPRLPDISKFDKPHTSTVTRDSPQSRRNPPMTGQYRLSTIASVQTYDPDVPATETESMLSKTTVTQNSTSYTGTSYTGTSYSGTSYTAPTKSSISRQSSKHSNLKRRLTKHSDLLSVLSLPDAVGPERSSSIRSACSVRTTRSHLATATLPDLLRELADDEVKYMRELRTLVDGVIPVLLTSVLSKSESAIAAGLFHGNSTADSDTAITKPIVDMGIALERLKSLHKRIPLQEEDQLIRWAFQAYKVYDDYLKAWRMGFRDVVVNLAPAARLASTDEKLLLDDLPRNAEGDVVNGDGERVDVAFLLKRPLVRIKHLNRIIKGVYMLLSSEQTKQLSDKYQDLLTRTRRRIKEEEARLENVAANNIDATRARDPRTLAPMENVKLNGSREVYAKDYFAFQLQHSTGQRIDCRVELMIRDKPKDTSDPGDLLICETNSTARWLLLPPIERDCISARLGDEKEELVVMIRGVKGPTEWRELFMLTADNDEVASEWIEMLGSSPVPPAFTSIGLNLESDHLQLPSPPSYDVKIEQPSTSSSPRAVDVPLGERAGSIRISRDANLKTLQAHSPLIHRKALPSLNHVYVTDETARANAENSSYEMSGALSDEDTKRIRPKRYHSRQASEPPLSSNPDDERGYPAGSGQTERPVPEIFPEELSPTIPSTTEMPATKKHHQRLDEAGDHVQKRDSFHGEDIGESDPNDTMNPESDGAPIPPAHKTLSPPNLKVPILESLASKFRNRRSSSPLKHEYQLSKGSDTSSDSSDSDSGSSYSDSSDDEELEALDISTPLPPSDGFIKKVSPPASVYSIPGPSIAPSQSASQAPYRGAPLQPNSQSIKLVASIFYWKAPQWVAFHPEPCSIVISAGLIEAYIMSASHSSPNHGEHILLSDYSHHNPEFYSSLEGPLIAMDLTPLVSTRCSSALDVEIKSPLLERSTLKYKGPVTPVRFRARTPEECQRLYAEIWRARLNNAVFIALEQERTLNSYGTHSYESAVRGSRTRSWFGRQNSYRASARAPSLSASDNNSNGTFSSALSALRRLSSGGSFNIAKSSVGTAHGLIPPSGSASLYTSSESGASVPTPRHTSASGSISTSINMQKIITRGSRNLKIRCYKLETKTKWLHLGSCRLTVQAPPPGMRQTSSLYNGIQKRVTVMAKYGGAKDDQEGDGKRDSNPLSLANRRFSMLGQKKQGEEEYAEDVRKYHIILDAIIGGHCFQRYQKTGIAINVWEDTIGPNGEIGLVRSTGGVGTGKSSKWMFQFGTAEETAWIYALCGGR